MRFEAADDIAATAEGDDDGIRGDRRVHDTLHLCLVRGIDDDIGGAIEVAGAHPDEIADALAEGVHDPFHRIDRGILRADDSLELGEELGVRAAFGYRDVFEGCRGRGRAVDVDADRHLHEGREGGLVLVVERNTVDAPAPPLHVFDIGHFYAPSDDVACPRIRAEFASRRRRISSRRRSVKSAADSPTPALMGAPKITPTG